MTHQRRRLPLLDSSIRHGNRSRETCRFRCGNACDHPVPNTSTNTYFGDLAASRRNLLRAGSVGALVVGAGALASPGAAGATEVDDSTVAGPTADRSHATGELSFSPVPPNTLDTVVVPNGYDHNVIIDWGTPITRGAPRFDIDAQTEKAQRGQFGYNCDYVGVLPLNRKGTRALLVVNHEYTNENLMFREYLGGDAAPLEQIRVAMAAHGMSVVEIVKDKDTGRWTTTMERDGSYGKDNRRIHLGTKFAFTGAAAGHRLLRTTADPAGTRPIGTLNNCAGGRTPWGTVLSGEENFNQYFVGGDGVADDAKPALKRYGFDVASHHGDDNRRFDRAEERFDLSKHPNEANRFGWIVEIDPFDPDSTPRKHTALGRFKHEGANVIIADDGRAVAYMGDDERFDYLYKFVSDKKMREGDSAKDRAHNLTLLETGTLYVAKLSFTSGDEIDGSGRLPSDGAFDGAGEWIPLVRNQTSFVDGFTAAEVLIHTRLAADAVGPTKLDRPEDVEPNPVTGKVYAALTNNTARGTDGKPGADEANPRNANKHGHVLELTEQGNDAAATRFTWNLFMVCGDPAEPSTFFAGFGKTKVSPISCPDNVAFDASGKNLWVSTDGNALGANDGLFAVPLSGPERGWLRQFLTVPTGAETCGPFVTDDSLSVFVAVQHPGEVDGATVDNPASTWPNGDYAKPGVVCVWRLDGARIGR
ncbi:PhoX family protein [Stackebrandtia soli]|uniref:PhoX family protein n=1 Tax=Stackebrandtia soli TaxID=1892856 RepID=UPI0039E9E803